MLKAEINLRYDYVGIAFARKPKGAVGVKLVFVFLDLSRRADADGQIGVCRLDR